MGKYNKGKKFGEIYGIDIVIPQCRVAWPALVNPKEPLPPKPGEQPRAAKYEATFLLDKDAAATDAFVERLGEMAEEMRLEFNDKKPTKLAGVNLVKDGDEFDHEKYPYYAGKWVIVARNASRPKTLDRNKNEISADKVIGGAVVKAVVTPVVSQTGLSYKLNIVQFVLDDGIKFAGSVRSDSSNLLDDLDGADTSNAMSALEASESCTIEEAFEEPVEKTVVTPTRKVGAPILAKQTMAPSAPKGPKLAKSTSAPNTTVPPMTVATQKIGKGRNIKDVL